MDWLKISLKCLSEDIENLTGLLLLYGWDELVIEDSSLVADLLAEKDGSWDYISEDLLDQEKHLASISFFLPENQGNRDLIDDFFSRLAIYNEQRSNPCCGEISLVNEEKWQDTWKEFFHPLPIGEKLVIKPTWEDYHPLPGQVILEIDPGQAFGSGQHETTSLCLEALQKYWHKQARIADIGCGSGILGIAAALLGATEVQSIDNDQKAVEISQENALLNNVSALVRAKKGDLSRGLQGEFDLILANIVADAIIDLAAQVGDFLNPQGIFIASGILDIRQEDVSKAFLLNDWQVLEIMEQGQWRAFIVQKQKQK